MVERASASHVARVGWAVLACAVLLAACSTEAPDFVSEPVAAATSTAVPTVEPTAAPSPTPAPTATPSPVPTPTPIPLPALTASGGRASALHDLRLDERSPWPTIGVTIDGRLRAVTPAPERRRDPIARVWIPAGDHEVCVGPVPSGSTPAYWEAETADEATVSEQTCARVSGTNEIRPRLFPGHRVVAYYGTGVTPVLGVLGEGTPEQVTERLLEATAAFDPFDLPTVPAFEFIATVAQARPGVEGNYTFAWPAEEVVPYLDQAREVGGVLILDFQPGRATFMEQLREYESLLVEPDVHLALDPEWSMREGGVPGRVIGSTDAETINEVLDYVQGLVVRHGLPQKLVIVHQFQHRMISDRQDIVDPAGIAVMYHVDGQGPVGSKLETYGELATDPPFFNGFKLFFDEDPRLMSPEEVMALDPPPVYISYQ